MKDILGTKTSIKILDFLFRNPQEAFKEIEVIRKSNVGKGAGATAINKLHLQNIVKINRVGKTKNISLNTLHPIAFYLKQTFDWHTFLSLPENRITAIFLFKENIYNKSKAIVLFGSLAAGTFNQESDIDLLVITDNEKGARNARKKVSEHTGERINVHLLKPAEIYKEYKENSLIRNALINGILIYGGDYIREIMRGSKNLKEWKFLKDRINAAWRNYTNKDYESAKEIASIVSEHMTFLACELEDIPTISRKGALSKIKKSSEYKILGDIGTFKIKKQLEVLEDMYNKLLAKTTLKGECLER